MTKKKVKIIMTAFLICNLFAFTACVSANEEETQAETQMEDTSAAKENTETEIETEENTDTETAAEEQKESETEDVTSWYRLTPKKLLSQILTAMVIFVIPGCLIYRKSRRDSL